MVLYQMVTGRLPFEGPPLAVLSRGYGVTRLASGEVVRSATQVMVGDPLEILLHRGALGARVTEVRERDERHQV